MTQYTVSSKANNPKTRRVGCTYCFDTLDPFDPQLENREFVVCTNCQAPYHSGCWSDSCLVCANDKVENLTVLPPTSLTSRNRHPAPSLISRPPSFKPSVFQIAVTALSVSLCLMLTVVLAMSFYTRASPPTPTVIVVSGKQDTEVPIPTPSPRPPTVTPSSPLPTRTATQDVDDTDTPVPPTSSATRTPRPSPEPSRTRLAEPPACPGAFPTRLTIGAKARVVNYQVNVRSGPGTDYSINSRLSPGRQVAIVDGPHCDDGQYWYEIISDPIVSSSTGEVIQVQGWVVEESGDGWFLEPVP